MSQFNVVKNAVSADQIYFDVTVTNFQSTTTIPPVFYYNEQRTMPFIQNPEDYYLSIQRFTVETGSIPVFIPSIQPNQGNRDRTIYSITLEYTDPLLGTATSGQVFIDWVPEDRGAAIPPPPNQTQNGIQVLDTGYYNAYSYQYWCILISGFFQRAYDALVISATGLGITLPSDFAPQLVWDTTSNTATLYADVLGYDQNPNNLNTQIKIFWNAPLFYLFSSFPAFQFGFNQPLGKNFQLLPFFLGSAGTTPILDVNTVVPPAAPVVLFYAIALYQEVSTVANMTPVSSIVFTSNTLPIHPSQVSTPLVFNNSQQIALGGNNADIANIITDLVTDSGNYRPNLVYTPSAEYRLITLNGNRPLFNLDLQIFYRVKTGQLIPFRLASGQSVTIKIAFLKKSSRGGASVSA
jgi:hypothetical protein